MTWEPKLASPAIEKLMEAQDAPESDRDEVRRFAELLERLPSRKPQFPLTPEMKTWARGEDTQGE
jgi:hypothetical protein